MLPKLPAKDIQLREGRVIEKDLKGRGLKMGLGKVIYHRNKNINQDEASRKLDNPFSLS